MPKIALVEDDVDTSDQLREWISNAVPDAEVYQLMSRDATLAALSSHTFDVISLDIKLGAEQNAGVGLIKEITRTSKVPVLVVSGLNSEHYRGVMKELDAWDYLVKPVTEHDYLQTLLLILRQSRAATTREPNLQMDPLKQARPLWKGKRLNLSATQQRLLHMIYERREADDPTVTYEALFTAVQSGRNRENIRKQVQQIKTAFGEIEEGFNGIVVEPMRGYRWVSR